MAEAKFVVYNTAKNTYAYVPLYYGTAHVPLTENYPKLVFGREAKHGNVLHYLQRVKELLGIESPRIKLVTSIGLIDSFEDGSFTTPVLLRLPSSIHDYLLNNATITKYTASDSSPLAGRYLYDFDMQGYMISLDQQYSSTYHNPYKISFDRGSTVYEGSYKPRSGSATGTTFYDFAGAGSRRDIRLVSSTNYDIVNDRLAIVEELFEELTSKYYSKLNTLLGSTDDPIQIVYTTYASGGTPSYGLICVDPTPTTYGYPLGTGSWYENQIGYYQPPQYNIVGNKTYFSLVTSATYTTCSPNGTESESEWLDFFVQGGRRDYYFGNSIARIYTDAEVSETPSLINSNTYIRWYVTNVFNNELPTYSEELQNDINNAVETINSNPTSIYTPGGDTADPYNPYPSGDSPATIDPLGSGEETVSTETDGDWELPFDDVPDEPSDVHSVALGLYNAYALSAMQVEELANYLFSGITELGENLVKLIWGSKRDVIISLIEFPIMVTTQGSEEIRFIFDTELAGMFHGKQLTNEYLPIDFGTIEVPRYSGTFYDFEPYTTLTLYIPYIGYIDLKPTEVVGSTLSISGYIHLTTGEIAVNVKSSRTGRLGTYSGTIGRMLPIADADATEIYSAIIKTAASLGAVAVAGVGASSAAATAASIGEPSTEAVEVASNNYVNAIEAWGSADDNVRQYSADMKIASHDYQRARNSYSEAKTKYNQVSKAASNSREAFHDAISEAGSNTLDAVTTGFNVSRGTIMTSSNGRLSPQRCFLRIEVPHQNVSRNQKILGYPANSADSLNSNRLHGYTELRSIELSISRATLTELQELEDILKGGFYLP